MMTEEQYQYKLNSIMIREQELERELDRLISIISGDKPFDEEKIRQAFNDTKTNIEQLKEEFRSLCKEYKESI